ncbi:MAG: hisS [Ramlibacter sp.]|nr:hisS [Ramlibacter sp.]
MATLEALRGAGVRVQQHAGGSDGAGSMKSQFKRADASGARFALVFGADELAQGKVTVKALRDGAGAQELRPLDGAASWASALT